ncbi:hypothetical protein HYV87_00090 [Candidatus Woesearchaeota archaeon]|nr:hypothetical protein [Candidatus Woesearchaeota archaeon]
MKKSISPKKSSRHHILLVSVFAIIIFLAVAVFILQRTNLQAVAGEAFRQTKQLALTEDQIKVKLAVQEGKEIVSYDCPELLKPTAEQHWNLEDGWKIHWLRNQDVSCFTDNSIYCSYWDETDNEIGVRRPDQVIIYKKLSGVKNCHPHPSDYAFIYKGCECELVK